MIKKIAKIFLTFIMTIVCLVPNTFYVLAESACEIDPESQECKLEKAMASSERIKELNRQMAEAENDLAKAQKLASDYYDEAVIIDKDIEELGVKIDELEANKVELVTSITENQVKVDNLNNRVLQKMAESQGTMHFSPFLDFILGSKGFADMLRRIYGIEAIMSKENNERLELMDILSILNAQKQELETTIEDLNNTQNELIEKQAEYITMMNYYNRIEMETEALIEEIRNALEDEKKNYKAILDVIGDISSLPSSAGLISPISNYHISAPFPYYPESFGGGIHLGCDYAASVGTLIKAPANGVIVSSYNGCATYGYLGNSCGGDGNGNGATYGGNQVYMIVTANNIVYGLIFCHMEYNSPAPVGVYLQGDVIGHVGSSGSSTGPHCHIEVFYLGPGDMEDIQNIYLQKEYSLSFNCGWGETGLSNLCDYNGDSAPCRLDPREYLGN